MSIIAIAIFGVTLAPTSKLDLRLSDQWTCQLVQTFVPNDADDPKEEEQRFTYQIRQRVTGVKRDEYDLESRSRLLKHRFGGEDLPPTKGAPDLIETLRVRPSGMRLFEPDRFADAAEFRLARLAWIGFPIGRSELPATWTFHWPGYVNQWAPGAEVVYRRTGGTERQNRQCTLLKFEYKETGITKPMVASGSVEFDEATGILMALSLTATNAPMPGGTELQRLEMTLEVPELKLRPRS